MFPKLYSDAHLSAAKVLFPDKLTPQWCEAQWTDEEINHCKNLESKDFTNDPHASNYPMLEYLQKVNQREEVKVLKRFLEQNPNIKTLLSVGCGYAEKEIYLAKKFPALSFFCIDNAPYVDRLNTVVGEMGLSNISFKRHDLREGAVGKFDLVFSMSVIYCIPDEFLSEFFSVLSNSRSEKGVIITGCVSALSPVLQLRFFLKSVLSKLGFAKGQINQIGRKQTGWLRPVRHVMRKVPRSLRIKKVFYLQHYNNKYPKFLNLISEKFFPLTNSAYLLLLE